MIQLPGGWAQWDYQIGTFRAEVDGVVFGVYTGEYPTAAALAAIVPLSWQDQADLEAEKTSMQEA